eukprot:scaffold15227_cov70-Cyclotella_meneghiniana.AAC.2
MPECAPVSAKSSLKMANFGRPLQRLHCRYRPPPGAINCFQDLKRRIVTGRWFISCLGKKLVNKLASLWRELTRGHHGKI